MMKRNKEVNRYDTNLVHKGRCRLIARYVHDYDCAPDGDANDRDCVHGCWQKCRSSRRILLAGIRDTRIQFPR
jgi:hypothetical protein